MNFEDAALETLLYPFATGQLTWNDDALFLRARAGQSLVKFADKKLICEQSFKPEADALQRAGFDVEPNLQAKSEPKKFSLILVLPSRQRDEARALFARAVSMLKPNGTVVACVSNNEGARSLESDLEKLIGSVNTLSKHKCRVFWGSPQGGAVDQSILAQWTELDTQREIANVRFVSRPGVFAWDRIDFASALLAKHFPDTLSGSAADLGAGFGYLAAELLQRCAGITSLDAYEAEHRALKLSLVNLAKHESRVPVKYHWHDVTSGLLSKYDVIVSNPPFHTHSRMDRPDIGRRFITVAAQSLNAGGQLWIVANRHLPYEEVLVDGFSSVKVIAEQQGFKVIAATKVAAAPRKTRK